MRPGQANENARGSPFFEPFYQNFTERLDNRECNYENGIECCMQSTHTGKCLPSDWPTDASNRLTHSIDDWEGMETMSSGDEVGMLLDLDEGTLSVYKNGRKLGVMKRGLAGPYCWAVSMFTGAQITIKRGTIPS